MRTFPGSFPPLVWASQTLDEYGEVWALTVQTIEEEAEAIRRARRASTS